MPDYRPYLPSNLHDEFDAFIDFHRVHGGVTFSAEALNERTDPYIVDQWTEEVLDTDRLDGIWDANARIAQQERNACSAEVLFPEFGLPFQIGTLTHATLIKYERTKEQIDAGYKAYNRWLADFCSVAPERFAGIATVAFDDVDDAVAEIRRAKEAGLKGVLLPHFDEEVPLYHPRFEPIWSTIEELGMTLNSHAGASSVRSRPIPNSGVLPHGFEIPIIVPQIFFYVHLILHHLIWGGVLERHPGMKVVLTEQGSGWVIGDLQGMDYTWEGSYLRSDIHELVRHRPSEYFRRQVSLGSSLFSRAEVEARYEIGIDKMALGMDYPHHEGAWAPGPGTAAYLQATLGAAGIPEDEARMLLSENAAKVWGFDLDALGAVAARVGPAFETILSPPTTDEYPRGDVHKPIVPL